MKYLQHKEGRATRLINLEGIRFVHCVSENLAGGVPRGGFAKIVYLDGYILDVPLSCGFATQDALGAPSEAKPNTPMKGTDT